MTFFIQVREKLVLLKASFKKPTIIDESIVTFESNEDRIAFSAAPKIVEMKNALETVKFDTAIELVKNHDGPTPSTSSSIPMKSTSGPYLYKSNSGVYTLDTSKIAVVKDKKNIPKAHLHSGVLSHLVIPDIVEQVPAILAQAPKKVTNIKNIYSYQGSGDCWCWVVWNASD